MCVLLVLSLPCIVASTYEEFSRLGIGTVEYYVHNLKLSTSPQTRQPQIQTVTEAAANMMHSQNGSRR